jgi:pyruvate formate lyase activating enzyme
VNTPQEPLFWWPAGFWRREGARVVCELCPFHCALRAGEIGYCHVRRRDGDALATAAFATAVRHWDAVERKPLYHFRAGKRALTLGAPGCTFRCSYCQNVRLSQYGREPAAVWRGQPVRPGELVAAAQAADGLIAISYSEPTLSAELTLALFEAAGSAGVELIWKTNGFITAQALASVAPCLAAANVDLKSADDAVHRHLTGAPVSPVLRAMETFLARGVWLEVSSPLLPGINTDDAALRAMAGTVRALGRGVPWHLVRVLPDYKRASTVPTSPAILARAQDIGRAAGLDHVYVERALGAEGRSTFCPRCQNPVVKRRLWGVEAILLTSGACPHCGEQLPGRW